LLRPPLLREVDIRLPRAAEPGERLRLIIAEYEERPVDREHVEAASDQRDPHDLDPRRRIVYLETLELG
jgi:hypothetical protein